MIKLCLCVLSFSINIGHDDDAIALHFNPRFNAHGDSNTIVCNSKQGGWGSEHREHCFPFQQGEEFKVTFDLWGSVTHAWEIKHINNPHSDFAFIFLPFEQSGALQTFSKRSDNIINKHSITEHSPKVNTVIRTSAQNFISINVLNIYIQ